MHGGDAGGFSGGHIGGGHVGGGHLGAGHGGHGVPGPHHHQHQPGPSDPVAANPPGPGLFSGGGRLRRPDTPLNLQIVRAVVLLGVIAALLWVALH
jgi:hypothetical protein